MTLTDKLVYLSISEITPYENNARYNDHAVEAVANSIQEYGFKNPIILDKNNVIIAGHTRYLAAKKLDLKEVPCIIADDLTPDQVKAFRIADNKTGELADWNFDLLEKEIKELTENGYDINLLGFNDEEMENILNKTIESMNHYLDLRDGESTGVEFEPEPEAEEDEFEVSIPDEPLAKEGDIYQLGNHRLMCGDSTNKAHIQKLMNGEAADLVLTDPPYNMGYEGAGNTPDEKRKQNKIKNDKLPKHEFRAFLDAVIRNLHDNMKDGASFYMFYKELGDAAFINAIDESDLTFKQELIWVKNHLVLGGSKYQSMYEPCLFGCKGPSIKNWYTGRKERSVIESIDLMDEFQLRDAIKEIMEYFDPDIIRNERQTKNDLHPTMKPIKLLSKFIKNSSKQGDIVLDVFGGSGSTLIACEQLNRTCYMCEFEPKYVDVIIERYEAFTGEKAIKIR